jgi:hypothetical protein
MEHVMYEPVDVTPLIEEMERQKAENKIKEANLKALTAAKLKQAKQAEEAERIRKEYERVQATPPEVLARQIHTAKYKAKKTEPPFVYAVLLYGPNGRTRVKVGKSINEYGLMANYHRVDPEASLIWRSPGGVELESAMHKQLKAYVINHHSGRRSEVFDFKSDDIDTMIKILEAAKDNALDALS